MSRLNFPRTSYSKVRNSKGALYDRSSVFSILDAGLVAHVGFVMDQRPMVIPMAYARYEETIYIHGAKAARIIKSPVTGAAACLTVTLVDGLVAARSAFHHSVNYRSVVVHGTLRPVTDDFEKESALIAITNHLLPDRWSEVRAMNEKEFRSTGVLALEIETATAKTRQGPPIDDIEDYVLKHWAGILPVSRAIGQPIDDGRVTEGTQLPPSLAAARQKFS